LPEGKKTFKAQLNLQDSKVLWLAIQLDQQQQQTKCPLGEQQQKTNSNLILFFLTCTLT
ncbi:hypothetical protein ACJX0J_032515, partial [Zea mays]